MPIATNSRTRFKKLSYKAPVIVHRGNLQQSTQQVEVEGIEENEIPNLGVDLSEVTEHHLQAALSSTQLASEGEKLVTAKPAYHIPTPESKQILQSKQYFALYPPGSYQDPVTYVRSSAILEECIKGPAYNLDEDDQEWLEKRNAIAEQAVQSALRDLRPSQLAKLASTTCGPTKGKPKEQLPAAAAAALGEEKPELYRVISEDELEMVLTVFEQYATEKAPFAHFDPEHNLPSLEEVLKAFDPDSSCSQQALPELPELPWEESEASATKRPLRWSSANPWNNLTTLQPLAPLVYNWWKEKRQDSGGKAIVPQLNFDESNDSDPYVCFRRREVKLHRKTRKTDVLHLEKLVKLKTEMNRVTILLQGLAQREKTKRASLALDREWWEATKELQEIKRSWGIVGPNNCQEDEDIISGERREEACYGVAAVPTKKKRTEEPVATGLLAPASKLTLKKSRTGTDPGTHSPAATATGASAVSTATPTQSLGQAIMDRVQAVQAYIERECLRKAETDLGWEEGSDSAYQPVPAPAHIRSFRPVQSGSTESSPFLSTPNVRAGRPPSFRRRLGRGGRVFLDRRLPAPSPVPTTLGEWPGQQRLPGFCKSDRSCDPFSPHQKLGGRSQLHGQLPTQSPSQLTGPFAFASDARPTLLGERNFHKVASSRDLSHSQVTASASHTHSSNVGSTSPASSERSKSSLATSDRASTIPTEADEMDEDLMSGDGVKELVRQFCDDESSASDSDKDEVAIEERARAFRERWRYDDESGRWAGLGLSGLGGMEDDQEVVLDDFDQRFMRYRMTLLEEEDLHKLSTDWTHIMQAQMALDCPPPAPQFSVIGPTMSAQQQSQIVIPAKPALASGDGLNAQAVQQQTAAAADAHAHAHAQAQAQAQMHAQQLRQQQAAATLAAATAAGAQSLPTSTASLMAPNVPSLLGAIPPTTSGTVAAKAAQTNVGGSLTALQQQQQIQQAHIQLAFQQHQQQQQQQQQQRQAQAAAAAAAQARAQAQAHAQVVGRVSPNLAQQQAAAVNRARMLSASQGSSVAGGSGDIPAFSAANAGVQMNRAHGSGSPQPHPLAPGQQTHQQQTGTHGQRFGFSANSPQMQSALAATGPSSRPSSSPAPPAGSSPLLQQAATFQQSRSPSMANQGVSQAEQQEQQQEQQRVRWQSNAQVPNQVANAQQGPPFNNLSLQQASSISQLQQQLVAMQATQSHALAGVNGGGAGAGNSGMVNGPTAAQLMAMKAALAQSMSNVGQNQVQLKLPPNRAMQQHPQQHASPPQQQPQNASGNGS